MSRMDWSKVHREDALRRNAPLRPTTSRRQPPIRSKYHGTCHTCGLGWKPMTPIEAVPTPTGTLWVHWTKQAKCYSREVAKQAKRDRTGGRSTT